MVLQEVDGLKWVKDVKIDLTPNKVYYFNPALSIDEMKTFQKKFNTKSIEKLWGWDVDFFNLIIQQLEKIESAMRWLNLSEKNVEHPILLYFETNDNGEIIIWQNVITNYQQRFCNNNEMFNLDSLESIKKFHTPPFSTIHDYYIDGRKLL
jgi:hypothetical protein